MMKTVFKEIIIVLLLLLVIILLLGIMFYDYMPNSRTIPVQVPEYALEETVQQELDKELENMESEEIIKTYQLDAIDIENYERTNDYNKGKVNPFAKYSGKAEGSVENGDSGNNTTTNDPSKDNFLNTPGK